MHYQLIVISQKIEESLVKVLDKYYEYNEDEYKIICVC